MMATFRNYLALIRLPNVFTAMADVLAGYWLFGETWNFPPSIGIYVAGSASLYAAGIVTNDLADVVSDGRDRPERLLPSGIISIGSARRLAFILLLGGMALVAIGATFQGNMTPIVVSAMLTVSILLYNFALKTTLFGPLAMAACRTLNLSLGASANGLLLNDIRGIALAAMFLYVLSLTAFARTEATTSSPRRLFIYGLGLVAAVFLDGALVAISIADQWFTSVLWLALLIHLARVALRAVRQPHPQRVQYTVKTAIFGIVALDAVVAGAAHGWRAAAIVLGLLLPTILLGRRFAST